jgi:alcohol dehydrogenase
MTNSVWTFATANQIRFGRGCIQHLTCIVRQGGLQRIAIVTDPIIAGLSQVESAIADLRLQGTQCVVFEGGEPEPSIDVAIRAHRAAQSIEAQGVIGVGGGSNMDVAKIVATLLKHGGTPADYFGFGKIPGPIAPLIAVPTTAGTGSEVSHSAVLTDTVARVKVSTLSPHLRPVAAIVDPSLTDSCPPKITAHSGIDALVHAIEALTNRPFHELDHSNPQAYNGSYPFTELLAWEAIRTIQSSLERAVHVPKDSNARDNMAYAAMLAGMAFSNSGVGLVHALEYPIGALTHCSHGEGNGLLLPYVMRFNEPVSQSRYRQLASIFKQKPESHCEPMEAIDAIEQLQSRIGIRNKLNLLGLRSEQIEMVADKAIQIERLMAVTARRPTKEDLVNILRDAF